MKMNQNAVAILLVIFAISVEVESNWLDRMVTKQLREFEEDVRKVLPDIEIEVIVGPRPHGFTDSPLWTEDDCVRLVELLDQSSKTPPRLRRMLGNFFGSLMTRRLSPPKKSNRTLSRDEFEQIYNENKGRINNVKNTKKDYDDDDIINAIRVKPKIKTKLTDFLKKHKLTIEQVHKGVEENNKSILDLFYKCIDDEDTDIDDDDDDVGDSDVIVITNPVESQLPSGRISVKLLKEILRNRAIVARHMPTAEEKATTIRPRGQRPKESKPDNKDSPKESDSAVTDGGTDSRVTDKSKAATSGGTNIDVTTEPAETEKEKPMKLTWIHDVNNSTDLANALASNYTMLVSTVIMGKLPPSSSNEIPVIKCTSIDTSLERYLSDVNDHNSKNADKQKGVKFEFNKLTHFTDSRAVLKPYSSSKASKRSDAQKIIWPLWLHGDVVAAMNTTAKQSIDSVQFLTEAENHDRTLISLGWTSDCNTMKESSCFYEDGQIGFMKTAATTGFEKLKNSLTFALQAALVSKSNTSTLISLLDATKDKKSTFTLISRENDHIDEFGVKIFLDKVGRNRVHLDASEYTTSGLVWDLTTIQWKTIDPKIKIENNIEINHPQTMLETNVFLDSTQKPIVALSESNAATDFLDLQNLVTKIDKINKEFAKPNEQKILKLTFSNKEALEKTFDILKNFTALPSEQSDAASLPIWLHANILVGPKIGSVLQTTITSTEFLTEAKKHPGAVLSLGWVTDIVTNTPGSPVSNLYTPTQINEMSAELKKINNRTVSIAMHASLAANTDTSEILKLFEENSHLDLTVTIYTTNPDDEFDDVKLKTLIDTIGRHRTYLHIMSSIINEKLVNKLSKLKWFKARSTSTTNSAQSLFNDAADKIMLKVPINIDTANNNEVQIDGDASPAIKLDEFLKEVHQKYYDSTPNKKSVKLVFKSADDLVKSKSTLSSYSKLDSKADDANSIPQPVVFPLWLHADVLKGPAQPEGTPIQDSEFLNKVESVKFLEAAKEHPRAVVSLGWATKCENCIKTPPKDGYTAKQIQEMVELITNNDIKQKVNFRVNANFVPYSKTVLKNLLRRTNHLEPTLTLWSDKELDTDEKKQLTIVIEEIGRNRVYIDVLSLKLL